MTLADDPVRLAVELIRCDTAGRNEDAALDVVEACLRPAGFAVDRVPWRDGRSNLVARYDGGGRLTFAAHVDTVPFDADRWSVDPLGGEIRDDRLFGRGASDMKSGAAAMVSAAVAAVRGPCAPFSLVFTSAEEVGCLGAASVAAAGLLAADPILVVGESTGNQVRFGHKGATWVRVSARGRSAHGSRPDLGINAIHLLSDAIQRLRQAERTGGLGGPHPVLGDPTVNVGTILGGRQANLVPDHAEMVLDIRTVRDGDVRTVLDHVDGPGLTWDEQLAVRSVWTEPDDPISRAVRAVAGSVTATAGPPEPVPYFTDAAVLAGEVPLVYICGPGDPDQPHTDDESCSVRAVGESARIYRGLLAEWTAGRLG
ncbi:succinyl-diaminopimelate desuccinylase [Nakamurella flavida]|uniref:M20 family metallopeptidase n=1 Tax=Nakamurella flavida TaxID=363630 RepID=UPI002787655F|nr:M20/M25/M40 family metallo-hydrolase [Nakamurella flavida]MDP9778523.1 succinyl-diaminopimelate desuccinylase [Nakamurella flavida]